MTHLTKEERVSKLKERFGSKLCFIGITGSNAYGTNIASSDLDLRGFALEGPKTLFQIKKYKTYNNQEYDTTIYSILQFVKNCLKGNPNFIDLLGLRNEDIIYISKPGEEILKNKSMFYSQRISKNMMHFSYNLEKDITKQLPKLTNLYINKDPFLEKKIEAINKTAMNSLRLLFMEKEFLETNQIITFRKESEILLDIRQGLYLEQNGEIFNYSEEYYKILEDIKKDLIILRETTSLPEEANKDMASDLLLNIYVDYFNNMN